MDSSCNGLVVVAMDFGTTFSGYAYSFKSEYKTDPKKIHCNTKWSSGSDQISSKTPTAILLKWNHKAGDFVFDSFGYDAQNRYTELIDEDKHEDYVLVDRFKMELYSEAAESGLRRNTELLLKNGKRIKAIKLISMFIKYLKDHFFQSISLRKINLPIADVRWVLTVPAIWTEGAKQLMREAAEMAGIPSSNLTVAFEPEAAALTCLYLTDPSNTDAIMKPGTRYLVIDAGGGTVDFTVHEVSDSRALILKHEPSGGPWGGTVVDQKFLDLLADVVGEDVFKQFATDSREDLVGLERDFEYKKRYIRDNQSYVNIRLPLSLGSIYQAIKRQPIQSSMSSKYGDEVKIVRDKIRIETQLVKKLFDTPCKNIVDHTKHLLGKRECRGVDTILLVGGFGGSEVVQSAVQESFPRHLMIIPENPELAVVKGAVLYGHNPLMVKTRIARYTYGTDIVTPFIEGQHPEDKKVHYDDIARCKDLFSVHVKKGQELTAGQPQEKERYHTVRAEQTAMNFKIYASTEKNPSFVTDDSCTYIGELNIAIPDTTGGRDRWVFCQMSFGNTEMEVTVTEEKTGKSVSATLNFLG